MAVKYTKTELKNQRDILRRYLRYLPTLRLKQQQLLLVIAQVHAEQKKLEESRRQYVEELSQWVGTFCDTFSVSSLIRLKNLEVSTDNIAGVEIPVFQSTVFATQPYDPITTPLWVDMGLKTVETTLEYQLRIGILKEAGARLYDELRVTTQRINLFEKVRIPETQKSIRSIRIFLSDQQTAEVVRGKIAKNKLARV